MSKPKPREIKFSTRRTPNGSAVVYHMAECSHDIFTKEQDWHFVEVLPDDTDQDQTTDKTEMSDSVTDKDRVTITRSELRSMLPCRCNEGYLIRDMQDPNCPIHDLEWAIFGSET